MNINSGGLFKLQASLSIDTSAYEAAVDGAISQAESLAEAIEEADGSKITVTASTDGSDDVESLAASVDSIDGTEAEANVDAEVTGGDDVESLDSAIDSIDGTQAEASVDAVVSGESDVESLGSAIESLGADGASGTANMGIASISDTVIKVLAGAATFGAISKVAGAIGNLAGEFAQSGDQIDKQSQRLNISREAYQEWSYVLSQSGMDISNLGRGMNQLIKQIADPSDDFSAAIKGIGLDVKDLQKMSTEDAFGAVISGLQGIGDASKKETAAMDIFGTMMGANLMPLLNTSAEDTQELVDAAHALGMVMSDEQVDAAVHYTDALDTLQRAIKGIKDDLIGEILPTLTSFMTSISGLIGMFTGDDDSLTTNIENVGKSFAGAISDINSQQLNADAIIAAMEALGDPKLFTPEQQAQWDALYQKLTEVMPGIKEKFGEQMEATDGATTALRKHEQAILDDAKAQAIAKAAADRQEALTEAYKQQTNALVDLNVANKKREQFENSDVYKSAAAKREALANGAEWTNDYYTDEEIKALSDYKDIVSEAADAQAKYNQTSAELAEAESTTEAWMQALYDIADYHPDMTAANQAVEDGLDKMVDTGKKKAAEFKDAMSGMEGTYSATTGDGKVDMNFIPKHKAGLDYVPYDDYLAYLHEGEKVLTKQEAAEYRNGSAGNAEMVAQLAAAIANRPISFSVGDKALATSITDASTRANALRSATVSSGYGRGMR